MQTGRSTADLEIRRASLLERIERANPKILALIAPAGFGKSTLVRQFLAGRPSWSICDCSDIRDDLDLARRLIPALAAERPEREHMLTQRELMMGDGGTSIAERVTMALAAWREPSEGTIVFENCEHLARSNSAREFFARVLASRPEGRTLVLCSREGLRMHLTRFVAPHEILVMRAADLAFDAGGVREIFGQLAQDDGSIERITALSQGWPIAVLLLRRFVAEGRIATLLDRLDDMAFEELHDYLADEVLGSLDAPMLQVIFACACIPRATVEDLRGAPVDPAFLHTLRAFAGESPFLTRASDGTYSVHPLLSSLLVEHQDERRENLLRDVAIYHEREKRFARAAELYLMCGDQPAAAHALGQYEVVRDPSPSMPYALLLSQLDRALVGRYPRLWGVTALLRMFCVDPESLLDEANSIWRTLPPDVAPHERYYIFAFRIILMSQLGLLEDALVLVDSFAAEAARMEAPRALREGYIPYLRALLRSRMGALSEAERDLTRALPSIDRLGAMASATLVALGADIARVRGERAVERSFIERAFDRARASGLANIVAFIVAEAYFGAWFAGEERAASRYAVALEAAVEGDGVRGFSYLAAVACGRDAEPADIDTPRFVIYARLIAASSASNERDAHRYARSALALAERAHAPFNHTLAAIAAALTNDAMRSEYLEVARLAALRCESQPLHAALEALLAGEPATGMLQAFVSRFAQERKPILPPIEIAVVRAEVLVDGRAVALSSRELELLVAIGLRREGVQRSRLIATLWPDQEEDAARNALSVALHRLRAHLGREDAIVRDGDGYSLHADARVDLWEIERRTTILRGHQVLRENDRRALEALAIQLEGRRPERMQRWEWFEPTGRRLRELQIEVTHRLASDALERSESARALELASQMIAHDPCDEPAREIAIRAFLALGDRAAALRMFRQYRAVLMTELACEPSSALAALVS